MADVAIRAVRVYRIESNGDLTDKCNRDVDLLVQYDPQGINLKILTGMYV